MAKNWSLLLTGWSLVNAISDGTFKKLFLMATEEATKTRAQNTETATTNKRKEERSEAFHCSPAMKQLMQPMAAPTDAEARKVARRNSGMLTSERMAP